MRLLKNKKGDVRTLAPTELVGYILAASIFILILIVAGIFTSLYFSEKNEEFAINNFIALANMIETLSKSPSQFEVQRAFPFYLPSDYVIVGFDREWDDKKQSDGCEPEPVRKPNKKDGKEGEKCQNSACICLFGDNNDDFINKDGSYNVKLLQCRSLPEVDYITTLYMGTSTYNYPAEIYKNLAGQKNNLKDYSFINFQDYAFFYLYGQCDNYWWDKNLQSRKLYIEKFYSGDKKTYIFIASKPEENKETKKIMGEIINTRFNAMAAKYKKQEKTS